MKTTIEVPDQLFRKTKATAALRGQSLREFVIAALEAGLQGKVPLESPPGWRAVFGRATPKQVASVDKIITRHLETIDATEWE